MVHGTSGSRPVDFVSMTQFREMGIFAWRHLYFCRIDCPGVVAIMFTWIELGCLVTAIHFIDNILEGRNNVIMSIFQNASSPSLAKIV